MSTSNIGLWTTLALCVAMGGANVFNKQIGQEVIMDCGDADQNNGFEWKHNTALVLRVLKYGVPSRGSSDLARRARLIGTKLKIPSVQDSDSGVYSCKGQNQKGRITRQHTLFIIVLPGPLKSSAPITALPGSAVTLPCVLTSPSTLPIVDGGWKPDPAADLHFPTLRRDASGLRWNGPKSRVTFSDEPLSTNFSVTLNNVQPSDSGVYVCTLTFENGYSLNATLNLKVERESTTVATVPPAGRPVITAPLGGAADLPCMHSSSRNLRVVGGKWLRNPLTDVRHSTLVSTGDGLRWNATDVNGSKVTFSDQRLSTNFTVTLNNVEQADAGVYVCRLTFNDGSDWSTEFELKVEGEEGIVAPGVRPPSKEGGFWENPLFLGLALWIWVAIAGGSLLLVVLVIVTVLVQCRSKRKRRKAAKNKIQMPSNQELVPMQKECPAKRTERQPRPGKQDRPLPPIPTHHQYKQIK